MEKMEAQSRREAAEWKRMGEREKEAGSGGEGGEAAGGDEGGLETYPPLTHLQRQLSRALTTFMAGGGGIPERHGEEGAAGSDREHSGQDETVSPFERRFVELRPLLTRPPGLLTCRPSLLLLLGH
ncbi:unnamed protein product [Closterium sp. NIES-65]|nr:unnamed protein product [Closterium sp. NIES-65]